MAQVAARRAATSPVSDPIYTRSKQSRRMFRECRATPRHAGSGTIVTPCPHTGCFSTPRSVGLTDGAGAGTGRGETTLRASQLHIDDGPATDDLRRIDYLPSPDEIATACASIRSAWTLSEKRRRFVGELMPDEPDTVWRPPVIDTSHFRLSASRSLEVSA